MDNSIFQFILNIRPAAQPTTTNLHLKSRHHTALMRGRLHRTSPSSAAARARVDQGGPPATYADRIKARPRPGPPASLFISVLNFKFCASAARGRHQPVMGCAVTQDYTLRPLRHALILFFMHGLGTRGFANFTTSQYRYGRWTLSNFSTDVKN